MYLSSSVLYVSAPYTNAYYSQQTATTAAPAPAAVSTTPAATSAAFKTQWEQAGALAPSGSPPSAAHLALASSSPPGTAAPPLGVDLDSILDIARWRHVFQPWRHNHNGVTIMLKRHDVITISRIFISYTAIVDTTAQALSYYKGYGMSPWAKYGFLQNFIQITFIESLFFNRCHKCLCVEYEMRP